MANGEWNGRPVDCQFDILFGYHRKRHANKLTIFSFSAEIETMSGYMNPNNEGDVYWGHENDPQLQKVYYEDYARFQKQQLGKSLRFFLSFECYHSVFCKISSNSATKACQINLITTR